MLNTPLVSDLIFKGDVHEIKQIMAKSRELGMQTFDQHLFDLYDNGLGHGHFRLELVGRSYSS